MSSSTSIQKALARALTNDRAGSVSSKDAKAIADAGIKEIFKSADPAATFARTQKFVEAAKVLVGSETAPAAKTLGQFETRGQGAVSARIEQLTGHKQLPAALAKEFKALLTDSGMAESAAAVKISNVKSSGSSFTFDYELGGEKKSAHAISYAGGHVLSPVKLTKATLDAATNAMRKQFDEEFSDLAEEHSAAEISAMRKQIVPGHAFFPGQDSDPYSYTNEYPVVLSMNNPTGSDHGFYVGIDPKKPSEASAYTFN
ncbi:MAG: hypothetical protein HY791_36780 [Deltaproteobacteria bacterium]|nr:hypothetical protein [Deltaproteobacteria bacterium]